MFRALISGAAALAVGLAAPRAASPKTHRLEATPATVAYGYYWAEAKPALRIVSGDITGSILSIGFLIASIVPTARFAQPIGAVILYPMIGLSGLFVPSASLPPVLQAVARLLPLTYVVSLLQGIWTGDAWSAHLGDVGALAAVSVVCTALSAKVFRRE
jgi:uncharacterized phage infection (PIP) family protein YhgE